MENQVNLSSYIADEDCYTTEDLSRELGVGIQRTREIIKLALKAHRVPNLSKQAGTRKLYAPQMAKQIVDLYDKGAFGRPRSTARVETAALVTATVRIFDPYHAAILKSKFPTQEKLVEFLRNYLLLNLGSISAELKKLDKEYESKKEALLRPVNEPKFS